MKVIDLKQKKDFNRYYEIFKNFIQKEVMDVNFNLKNNYTSIDLEDYLSFTCLIDKENKIQALSGLQKAHFPGGHVRALNKLLYSQKIRSKGYRRFPSLASIYMLPNQLRVAVENDVQYIFISLQNNLNRVRFVKKYVKALNQSEGSGEWILLEGLYNTCRLLNTELNNSESCWQHIICQSIGGLSDINNFQLKKRSYEKV